METPAELSRPTRPVSEAAKLPMGSRIMAPGKVTDRQALLRMAADKRICS